MSEADLVYLTLPTLSHLLAELQPTRVLVAGQPVDLNDVPEHMKVYLSNQAVRDKNKQEAAKERPSKYFLSFRLFIFTF